MDTSPSCRPALTVRLAAPRGFCAGVERAILIVERALQKFGAPVYVRHEIVHNRHVVERLRAAGAIFVEALSEAPDDRPIVFSAHGVPKSVPAEAGARRMLVLDATCPLVSKVHIDAEKHFAAGREIILIGHAGHPEVVGTLGQLPEGAIALVETIEDAERFQPRDPARLAYVTQTTLSVDETRDILAVLRRRFPAMTAPHRDDICYATTNRQDAVTALGAQCDLVLVVGSPTSSNSRRLVETALKAGARASHLVDDADEIDWRWFEGAAVVGVTAGASAPEDLVQGLIAAIGARFDVRLIEEGEGETITFKLPRLVADA